MDSLKSLIDQKNYDLVIKLTETSTTSTDLFYRISAFICLGKYEEALFVIQDHQAILESNLAALINVHINLLCALSRFEQAHIVLDYYANLPYQSQVVEEILRKMPDVIAQEEKKMSSVKYYDTDQLLEMLDSKKDEEVLLALDIIKSRDILEFLPKLKSMLVSYPRETTKSYILMMLVRKEVDRDLVMIKEGKEHHVNPKQLIPPFTGETFDLIVKKFDREFKDASISQIATQLFSQYCIYIYPIELKPNPELYALVFFLIANQYMESGKQDIDIASVAERHNLKVEEVESLKKEVEKALADF